MKIIKWLAIAFVVVIVCLVVVAILLHRRFTAHTVPPFGIFLWGDKFEKSAYQERIVKHELVHWRQYQEMGLVKFYYNYFKGLITSGYRQSPMEIEARKNSGYPL